MTNWSMWDTLKREKTSSLLVCELDDADHDDDDDGDDDDDDGDDDNDDDADDDGDNNDDDDDDDDADDNLFRAACKQMFCQGGFSGRRH